jgi:nitroimidazol reductase NimA-like FMN-containing flavoprotein (pyridoxamine 5'-phosphate oxidase superfamily)
MKSAGRKRYITKGGCEDAKGQTGDQRLKVVVLAVIVEAPAEKSSALDRIMEHYGAEGPFSYPDETLARTAVIRIEIESLTGKRRE